MWWQYRHLGGVNRILRKNWAVYRIQFGVVRVRCTYPTERPSEEPAEFESRRPHYIHCRCRTDTHSCVGNNDIDFVIMRTHRRTGIERRLIRSVTERVVGEAAVPVLTVGTDSEK
ncbi:universal stress protein (plasmid) [Haladaptatus sp. SPP-AMP-3]|uniref:universal stress protein n=1 Tax=Haladaptatus sp. SPP-AMP-3 TaxID=3121295 RepID=UPI003C2D5077